VGEPESTLLSVAGVGRDPGTRVGCDGGIDGLEAVLSTTVSYHGGGTTGVKTPICTGREERADTMSDPTAACPDHGFYSAAGDTARCPQCGTVGEQVLDGRRRRRLSTFLSGVLRHFPGDVGVRLDPTGWTPLETLVAAAAAQYDWAGEREVRAVVATDPKGRFETRRDGDQVSVRAAYGHSVDVDLDRDSDGSREDDGANDVPETLYHGTAPWNLAAIRDEGLRPMNRQAVHLSGDRETARAVGRRHADGDSVVLVVDARGLSAAGFTVRRRGRETYTVEHVPPRFLSHGRTE
jgi:putative RNA 2'-phosphotransferase